MKEKTTIGEDITQLRVLAVVPARGGSKRLPGKNVRELGGKPLIVWTIESALGSGFFCDVLVSTDEPTVAEIAASSGAMVPWLRPACLALDDTPSIDVVIHALTYYEGVYGAVDAVMLLQPTSPFRSIETIRKAFELFNAAEGVSVVAVSPAKSSWPTLGRVDNEGWWYALNKQERQIARNLLTGSSARINGLVYLSTPDTLKSGSILTDPCRALVITDFIEAVDIDTYEDWKIAEYVAFKKTQESVG